ncbi:hypothetical protein BH24ACT5_BH24ACT5_01570 [soil metagenome]
MERRFDAEGRLIIDWDSLKEAARRGGPPTSDDVTILGDGRRLDTADKVRAFVAECDAAQTRRRVRGPRSVREPAQR